MGHRRHPEIRIYGLIHNSNVIFDKKNLHKRVRPVQQILNIAYNRHFLDLKYVETNQKQNKNQILIFASYELKNLNITKSKNDYIYYKL